MGVVYLRGGRALVIGIVLSLLAGISFLIAGTYILYSNLNLTKNGYKAEGTVTALIEHRSANAKSPGTTSRTYRPEIEFKTSDGQNIRTVYPTGSNPPSYSVGQKVNIIYSKDNPGNLIIDSKFEIIGFPTIFIFLGILFLIIGCGIIIIRKFK